MIFDAIRELIPEPSPSFPSFFKEGIKGWLTHPHRSRHASPKPINPLPVIPVKTGIQAEPGTLNNFHLFFYA